MIQHCDIWKMQRTCFMTRNLSLSHWGPSRREIEECVESLQYPKDCRNAHIRTTYSTIRSFSPVLHRYYRVLPPADGKGRIPLYKPQRIRGPNVSVLDSKGGNL